MELSFLIPNKVIKRRDADDTRKGKVGIARIVPFCVDFIFFFFYTESMPDSENLTGYFNAFRPPVISLTGVGRREANEK